MKRAVVITVLLLYALRNGRPVYASENIFTTTRLVDFASTIIRVSEDFGFHLYNYIVPSYTKENENAYVDYEPYAITMSKFSTRAEPGTFRPNNKIIDWTTEIVRTSLYGAILKASAPHGENVTSDECYISEGLQKSSPVLYLPLLLQSAKFVNSRYGLFTMDVNENGKYNFDKPSPPLIGMNPNEDCKKHNLGEPAEPFGNDQVALSSFGNGSSQQVGIVATMLFDMYTWITETFTNPSGTTGTKTTKDWDEENAKQEVILTKKIAQRNNPELCHLGSQTCSPRNMTDSVEGLQRTGGVFSGFVAAKAQVQVDPNCVVNDKVTLLGFPAGKMENAEMNCNMAKKGMEQGGCMVVSGSQDGKFQKSAVYGTAEKGEHIDQSCGNEKPVACPIDVIEKGLSKTSLSCSLKNTGSYTSSNTYLTDLEKSSLKNGIPPLMQKVLEAAGSTYNVPASVLLGTMLEEGAFEHAGTWDWSDETVRTYSDCTVKDPMPSCRDFGNQTSEGATGPFGYIQNWWDNYIESGGPYKAYENDPAWKEALVTAKPNYNECNFTDAAFTAARELGEDQSHYQPAYVPVAPQQCAIGGVTYNTNIADVPTSCGSWNTSRVAMARMQYADRTCTDDVQRMVTTFSGL